ncbi:MAG: hydroxysqualene dehydroxylase HpnE [Terriglobia bacterium]
MSDEILIIGGGFAGLAAGVALAGSGCRVRLIEQRPYLGGRARSFFYKPAESIVDNGQHIFMGCYHETLRFLKTIGTLDSIRFQPDLAVHFMDRETGASSLTCPHLPAPWHLLAGVMRSNSFPLSEKLQVLRLGRALRHADFGRSPEQLEGLTVDGWMAALGQSKRLRRNLWDLLCIAALNEDPRIAAAAVFEPVLRRALFHSRADSCIGLASKGLSECYTSSATSYIESRGGKVELGQSVGSFIFEDLAPGANDRPPGAGAASSLCCRGVKLTDNTEVAADKILSTVPSFEFVRLLPDEVLLGHPFFERLTRFQPAPIVSVNLWFDREITEMEFAGLRGTTVQWLFNKGRILNSGRHYVSLVISGAHEHIHEDKEELLALALTELRALFPAAREARLLHSLVLKERFATFSPAVGALPLRPPATTPIRNLYLAGDWTDTGLPATIESAVKSGYTAAAEILRREERR